MQAHPSSYRDSEAQVFAHEGNIFRNIHELYLPEFKFFINSTLSKKLINEHKVIPFEISNATEENFQIKAKRIVFENYPYEWSFEQLKQAALLTLDIMTDCLDNGMILKDANPSNIMFEKGIPVFIDHGSFKKYHEGDSWVAYKQFLETFLAPLALCVFRGRSIKSIFLENISGVPIQEASKVLPFSTKFKLGLFLHIHMAAKRLNRPSQKLAKLSSGKIKNIIRHLRDTIIDLKPSPRNDWSNYYKQTHDKVYYESKWLMLENALVKHKPIQVLDIGSNTGYYTQKMNSLGQSVIAIEANSASVDIYYEIKAEKATMLHMDVCNLSPATGVLNLERKSFLARNRADFILCFALIHHLYFTSLLSLDKVVELLAVLTQRYVMLEWIEISDEKCQEIIVEARVEGYSKQHLLTALEGKFNIISDDEIKGKNRSVLMLEAVR